MADLTERTTKLTEKTSHLTEKTTHDSATIKWLTFLTLIYLPASFVAVSLQKSFLTITTNLIDTVWDESLRLRPANKENRHCQ